MYPVDLFVKIELIVPIIISECSSQMLMLLYFRFQRVSQLKVSQEPVRMSMMDPNLLDAATFGGPTSPLGASHGGSAVALVASQ